MILFLRGTQNFVQGGAQNPVQGRAQNFVPLRRIGDAEIPLKKMYWTWEQ